MNQRLKIFDTTLRDGEQSPGASMTVEQKVKMAIALERLGVDRIQFDSVKQIGKTIKKATVVALARCTAKDINAAHRALKECKNKMIHVFIATSPIHRKHKLKMSKDEILLHIIDQLSHARKYFNQIEFSAEDATRTEPEFLFEVIRTAITNGATSINIPDTVGYAIPQEFGELIQKIIMNVSEFEKKNIDLSVHCHNDLGLAVSNSISAIQNGATQVEVTMNGIGERAGNCSLEELVMALEVRKDRLAYSTGIETERLYPTSRLLQHITGLIIARNKPIFGDNAFSHEAGIHQDGVLKNRNTYEIMKPSKIGRSEETLVLGRHSGKHSFRNKLNQYHISLTPDQFDRAFQQFIRIADLKKEVYDEDLFNLVASILGTFSEGYRLDYFHVYSGNKLLPSATIRIKYKGKSHISSETGDGPVDALFRAIDSATGIKPKLKDYQVHAIGSGKDAQGQVKLMIDINGNEYVGKGTSTDILEASALAYLNAINRDLFRHKEKKSN
jgi:2-isopropylmalate synthase